VVKKYCELCQFLLKKLEKKSTLEADLELLDQSNEDKMVDKDSTLVNGIKLSFEQKMAVVYRSERKKILKANVEYAQVMQMFLDQVSELDVKSPDFDK